MTPCHTSATRSGVDERPEALAEAGDRRESPADPEVVADPELGVLEGDERAVVDLVHDVLAGVAGDRGLVLARQVRERLVADEPLRDLEDLRGRIDELVSGDAGDRGSQDHAGHVAAGLGGAEVDILEAAPDLRNVLDADPVQLDVLPIGEVGGVARELGGDPADHAQLVGRELPAVDAHAQHEVLVLELVRLELGGAAAVDSGLALRVQAPPAEPAMQVGAGRSRRNRPARTRSRSARARSVRCRRA